MNFGLTELLVIFAIAALLFGTRKLRGLGSDLGSALRGFRNALQGDNEPPQKNPDPGPPEPEMKKTEKPDIPH